MNLRVPVHEEGEVELIRLEQPREGQDEATKLAVQRRPLVGLEIKNGGARSS